MLYLCLDNIGFIVGDEKVATAAVRVFYSGLFVPVKTHRIIVGPHILNIGRGVLFGVGRTRRFGNRAVREKVKSSYLVQKQDIRVVEAIAFRI